MYQIIIQQSTEKSLVPKNATLRAWAKKALQHEVDSAELTIRIVDSDEMIHLNMTYRKKAGPTNVLSFPCELPKEIQLDIPILGDVIICAAIVNQEANEQKKSLEAHWAHMIIHGCLHLLGYDHENDQDARTMEATEIKILTDLGFANPY